MQLLPALSKGMVLVLLQTFIQHFVSHFIILLNSISEEYFSLCQNIHNCCVEIKFQSTKQHWSLLSLEPSSFFTNGANLKMSCRPLQFHCLLRFTSHQVSFLFHRLRDFDIGNDYLSSAKLRPPGSNTFYSHNAHLEHLEKGISWYVHPIRALRILCSTIAGVMWKRTKLQDVSILQAGTARSRINLMLVVCKQIIFPNPDCGSLNRGVLDFSCVKIEDKNFSRPFPQQISSYR